MYTCLRVFMTEVYRDGCMPILEAVNKSEKIMC